MTSSSSAASSSTDIYDPYQDTPPLTNTNISDLPIEMIYEIFDKFSQLEVVGAIRALSKTSHKYYNTACVVHDYLTSDQLNQLSHHHEKFGAFIKKLSVDSLELLPRLKLAFDGKIHNSEPSLQKITVRKESTINKEEEKWLSLMNHLLFDPPYKPMTLLRGVNFLIENEELCLLLDGVGHDKLCWLGIWRSSDSEDRLDSDLFRNPLVYEFEREIERHIHKGLIPTMRDLDGLLQAKKFRVLQLLRTHFTGLYGLGELHFSAMCGNLEELDDLIKKGLDVNAISNSERTPLHYAVIRGDLSIVNALLQAGADPTIATTLICARPVGDVYQPSVFLPLTPLTLAVSMGHLECVKVLAPREGVLFHRNNYPRYHEEPLLTSEPPLPFWFALNQPDIMEILLKNRGSFLRTENITALMNNLIECAPSMSKILFNITNNSEINNCSGVFEQLLHAEPNLENWRDFRNNGVNYGTQFLLNSAVVINSVEGARFLLERGVDPNQLGFPDRAPGWSNLGFPLITTIISGANSDEMKNLLKSYGAVRYANVAVNVTGCAITIILSLALVYLDSCLEEFDWSDHEIKVIIRVSLLSVICWYAIRFAWSSTSAETMNRINSFHASVLWPFVP